MTYSVVDLRSERCDDDTWVGRTYVHTMLVVPAGFEYTMSPFNNIEFQDCFKDNHVLHEDNLSYTVTGVSSDFLHRSTIVRLFCWSPAVVQSDIFPVGLSLQIFCLI